MGNVKGYIECAGRLIDLDESDAVLFVVVNDRTVTEGIFGDLTGIGEHVSMTHAVNKITELEKIIETEEPQ